MCIAILEVSSTIYASFSDFHELGVKSYPTDVTVSPSNPGLSLAQPISLNCFFHFEWLYFLLKCSESSFTRFASQAKRPSFLSDLLSVE